MFSLKYFLNIKAALSLSINSPCSIPSINKILLYKFVASSIDISSLKNTSHGGYIEDYHIRYKNVVSSSYRNYEEPFSKHTYISSIGIYDENKNLIAKAKLATPIRKREIDEYIFKLKLDI